jgi:tRNA-dihydrouridine synthase B
MNNQQTSNHFFYFAPIKGITDRLFRTIYHKHFPYFDAVIAPFINPQRFAGCNDKLLADIIPGTGDEIETIPQLLYNTAEDFINLGKRLEELGYTHINWNLGCPSPMVANKQRGSGLLPHGDRIIELLEAVTGALNAEISLKMRLGFKSSDEIRRLLPRLDQFDLKEITIHPRLGKQLYRGYADRETFAECRHLTRHSLVYNGDIVTKVDFTGLCTKFTDINRWMIGRGALADPFLMADIKEIPVAPAERTNRIRAFHDDLYEQLKIRLSGPGHLLNRMKQIWAYLIESFPDQQKMLKKIRKVSSEEKYAEAIEELFEA